MTDIILLLIGMICSAISLVLTIFVYFFTKNGKNAPKIKFWLFLNVFNLLLALILLYYKTCM